jgi:thymidine phosphorylase
MLVLGGASSDLAAARLMLERALADGAAIEKFREIVVAQSGDPRVCDDPRSVVAQPAIEESFLADRDGFVRRIDPRTVGKGITAMGGGRNRMEDRVDPSVGFLIAGRLGQAVRRGDRLAVIQARDSASAAAGRAALAAAITIGEQPMNSPPLISHRVSASGVEVLA